MGQAVKYESKSKDCMLSDPDPVPVLHHTGGTDLAGRDSGISDSSGTECTERIRDLQRYAGAGVGGTGMVPGSRVFRQ